jgi:hypothetical protein
MRSQTARICSSVAWDCITTSISAPEWNRERESIASEGGEAKSE